MGKPAGMDVIEQHLNGAGSTPEAQQLRVAAVQALSQRVIQRDQQRRAARLDAVRIAADTIRENHRNKMQADSSDVSAIDIVEFAEVLVSYINGGDE